MENAVERFVAMTTMFDLKQLTLDDMQRNFKEMRKDRELGKLLQHYEFQKFFNRDASSLLFYHLRSACLKDQLRTSDNQVFYINKNCPYSKEVFDNMDITTRQKYYKMVEQYIGLNMQHYAKQPVKIIQNS